MIYPILLISGFAGLVVMTVMGFAHGFGHHGHGHGAHHGHLHTGHAHTGHTHTGEIGLTHGVHGHAGHGHAGHAGHAHCAQGHDQAQQADGDADGDAGTALAALVWVLPLLSPLNWFSWMVGAGAAGSLAAPVPEPFRAAIAVAGAAAFNGLVVKPIWNFIFGFTSRPARNLEGCLAQEVEAVTAFDEKGVGLVRVTIDGHSEDVLARLENPELSLGRVRRGDRLRIEDVDPHTNSCRVSRA